MGASAAAATADAGNVDIRIAGLQARQRRYQAELAELTTASALSGAKQGGRAAPARGDAHTTTLTEPSRARQKKTLFLWMLAADVTTLRPTALPTLTVEVEQQIRVTIEQLTAVLAAIRAEAAQAEQDATQYVGLGCGPGIDSVHSPTARRCDPARQRRGCREELHRTEHEAIGLALAGKLAALHDDANTAARPAASTAAAGLSYVGAGRGAALRSFG